MARELKSIDITNMPELISIVEEIRRSGEARVLRRDSEDLVVITPAKPKAPTRRGPTRADREAFLASAGSWKDLDIDKFIADNYESRKRSSRPPVTL